MGRIAAVALRFLKLEASIGQATINQQSNLGSRFYCSRSSSLRERLRNIFDRNHLTRLEKMYRKQNRTIFISVKEFLEIFYKLTPKEHNAFYGFMLKKNIQVVRKNILTPLLGHPLTRVLWLPPPRDFVKVNTDASFFGTLRRSCGGVVVRDEFCHVLAVVSCEFKDKDSSFEAELEALELGMFVASRLGHRRVIFELDNLDVQRYLTSGRDIPHEHLLKFLSLPLSLFFDYEVNHVLREANQVADSLAKFRLHYGEDFKKDWRARISCAFEKHHMNKKRFTFFRINWKEPVQVAKKRSVGDLKEVDLKGAKVLVRVDLNVPLDDNFNITDDTKIRAAVPTIKYLMTYGAKVILSSHLGRPKGVTPKYSLMPLVPRLSEFLGVEVKMATDCIGKEVVKMVAALQEGSVLLLENVMFYKEEEKNDPAFAKKLALLADLYVNDAFGTAHRAHASTEGVAKYLKPAVAGFLMQKELEYLVGDVSNTKRPFAAIVGGSKLSSNIRVIESFLEKVDILLLGGAMISTFYAAQGHSIGSSLVEEDEVELAAYLLESAKSKGVSLILPSDVVIADKFAADANNKIVPASCIPDGWMALDIGPNSIKAFGEALDTTKTIIWYGYMGMFEFDKFPAGTEAIAKKLADLSGEGVTTIIGGGDSVAVVEKFGLAQKMSHISTGGDASFELLEGKQLPGVQALTNIADGGN